MRSIDDIIDKFDDSSSVERVPDESQSPTVASSVQQHADAGDRDRTLRVDATSDARRRQVSALSTEMKSETPGMKDRRQTAGSGTSLRLGSTSESTGSRDTEQLWAMFGTPLSQFCQHLLTDFVPLGVHERSKPESVEPRITDVVCAKTGSPAATTQTSKSLRQSAEVPSVPASVDVRPSSSTGVVQSNGRASHAEGHKPPLPAKPSLPPKPPIAKKPSLSKEVSAGLARKSSSLSAPPCTSTTTQQQQTGSTSSHRGSVTPADDPLTTSTSAPTSPTTRVIQRDAGHQQQVAPRRTTSMAQSRSDAGRPARTTKLDDVERRPSPVRDRMKTTKSEEFLARIHRRSVSPLATPKLVSRSARGRSVDLTAASDTPATIGRRTLSKEWAVVTTTTQEEVTVVYRPPATTSPPEIVRVDAPIVASSAAGVVKGQGQGQDTVNNNAVDSSGGRLYKTTIDNIRLSVGGSSNDSGDGDSGVSRQIRGVGSASAETGRVSGGGGRESTNSTCQLDDLISSLIEIAVDVEGAQPVQRPSLRHEVVFTAHY